MQRLRSAVKNRQKLPSPCTFVNEGNSGKDLFCRGVKIVGEGKIGTAKVYGAYVRTLRKS